MILKEVISASPSEFYSFLKETLCTQVLENTGKTCFPAQIQRGFSYRFEKKNKKLTIPVVYTVKAVKKDRYFEAEIKEPDKKTIISYTLSPIKDQCKVVYEQVEKDLKKNEILSQNMLQEARLKRQFKKQLEEAAALISSTKKQ